MALGAVLVLITYGLRAKDWSVPKSAAIKDPRKSAHREHEKCHVQLVRKCGKTRVFGKDERTCLKCITSILVVATLRKQLKSTLKSEV